MLIFLQDEDAGAFAHDKAASAFVKRCAGALWVLVGGQRLAVCKACHSNWIDGCLGAAGNDGVGIAIADGAERLTQSMGGGGTGGDNRQVWSLCIKADGDVARRDVADHHRDQKWGDMARSGLEKLAALLGDGADAAGTGTDIDAQTFRLDVFSGSKACILHCLYCCRDGILGKQVGLSDLCFFDVLSRLKVLDLGRYLDLLVAGVKAGNHSNAVFARNQTVPKVFNIISNRRDHTHAGDYYSIHPCSSCGPLTYSVRRRCAAPDR